MICQKAPFPTRHQWPLGTICHRPFNATRHTLLVSPHCCKSPQPPSSLCFQTPLTTLGHPQSGYGVFSFGHIWLIHPLPWSTLMPQRTLCRVAHFAINYCMPQSIVYHKAPFTTKHPLPPCTLCHKGPSGFGDTQDFIPYVTKHHRVLGP